MISGGWKGLLLKVGEEIKGKGKEGRGTLSKWSKYVLLSLHKILPFEKEFSEY